MESARTKICLQRRRGRLEASLLALPLGGDLQVMVSGGKAHIGATALCQPGGEARCLSLPGHREGELAASMARSLANALGITVAVSAGIHFDDISREEIATILAMCAAMAEEAVSILVKTASRAGFPNQASRQAE